MSWLKSLLARLFNAKGAERTYIIQLITIPLKWTGSSKATMELYSFRRWYTDNTTISELSIDQESRFCYLLEPTVRVGKDPRGIVAIPEGRYEITLYDSPRFKMKVPLLNGIVGHSYVEIHPGNTEHDSLDCLLPGLDKGNDCVLQSRDAFKLLFARIDAALNTKSVFITIKNQGA